MSVISFAFSEQKRIRSTHCTDCHVEGFHLPMSRLIVFDDSITQVRAMPRPPLDETDADARIPWTEDVVAFDGSFLFCLQGIELGRSSLLATGDVLPQGRVVTLTLELEGQRVYVLARVEWSAVAGDTAVSRLSLSVTSPGGNDLLARAVRSGGAAPLEAERAQTDELALGDDDCSITGVWRRDGTRLTMTNRW